MTILIDADGCPVVEETLLCAGRFKVPVVILCDTSHQIERPGARTVTVSKGADSVDYALVDLVSAGDLAVTQDYGLAAMCLARRARVLDQNGMEYTDDNISALLEQRAYAGKLRRAGGRLKGPRKRTPAQDAAYTAALQALLQAMQNNA